MEKNGQDDKFFAYLLLYGKTKLAITYEIHLLNSRYDGVVMSEKKSTFGLKLDQLADLLAVGMEQIDIGDGNNPGHPLTDQLQDILTHPLFQESGLLDSVQVAMDLQGRDMDLLADRSLGEVLLDPDTDLELLQIRRTPA